MEVLHVRGIFFIFFSFPPFLSLYIGATRCLYIAVEYFYVLGIYFGGWGERGELPWFLFGVLVSNSHVSLFF